MSALPINFDPYNPIPNSPFYSPASNYVQGPFGPLVIGSGLSVSSQGILSSSGGSGGGTVTSVATGFGLTGGPIVNSGTISLAPSGALAGAYTFPAVSVDAYGRITSISSGSPVTSVAVNAPLSIAGSVTSPTISIQGATTTQIGVTQLNNTTSSTLTNQALTAAAGKNLQDQINALSQNANGLILAGTLNASTGNVVNATTAGISGGFTSGAVVPAASPAINDYYVIVTTGAASYTPTGGPTISNVIVGDYILVASGAWTILRIGPVAGAYATTTTAGIIELATNLEAITGTDPNLALTPATGAAAYVPKNLFTTKGQVFASTGCSTLLALGPGVDGTVLTADSSCSGGMKWAAGGGGGGGGITSLLFNAPLTATTNPVTSGSAAISVNAADTLNAGVVKLADTATTITGLDTTTAITPAGAAATYVAFCDFTAKGQLIASTAACAYGLLTTPGTDNLALVSCAACATGMTFANPLAPATPNVLGAMYGIGQPGATVNFGVGCNALVSVTTGAGNTAVGIGAMALTTTACFNVAVGGCALYNELTSNDNVAVGSAALKTSNGGFGNVAVGACALCALTTGDRNVAIGWSSGDAIDTGFYNTLVGESSGSLITSGQQNVVIGANSGAALTTGGANTLVGDNAGGNVSTQNYQIVLGGGSSCALATICGGVTFRFGGTCALYALANGTNTWTAVSDQRLKENVADLALGLDFVNKLQPRTFNWKADETPAAGFIAQEAAAVVDEYDADYLGFVDKSNEFMGVGATALIPVLVNAIKELKAELDELKAKVE